MKVPNSIVCALCVALVCSLVALSQTQESLAKMNAKQLADETRECELLGENKYIPYLDHPVYGRNAQERQRAEVGDSLPYAIDLSDSGTLVTFEYQADMMPLEQEATILKDKVKALVQRNMELRHELAVRNVDNHRLLETVGDLERELDDLRNELADDRSESFYGDCDSVVLSRAARPIAAGYIRDGLVFAAERELGRPLTEEERITVLEAANKEASYFTAEELAAILAPFSVGAGSRILAATLDVRERAIDYGLSLQPW